MLNWPAPRTSETYRFRTRMLNIPDTLGRDCMEKGIQTFKREFKLPWRKAGLLKHHNDMDDSDQ